MVNFHVCYGQLKVKIGETDLFWNNGEKCLWYDGSCQIGSKIAKILVA